MDTFLIIVNIYKFNLYLKKNEFLFFNIGYSICFYYKY